MIQEIPIRFLPAWLILIFAVVSYACSEDPPEEKEPGLIVDRDSLNPKISDDYSAIDPAVVMDWENEWPTLVYTGMNSQGLCVWGKLVQSDN